MSYIGIMIKRKGLKIISITYEDIKKLVNDKLNTRTNNTPYDELSEYIFGDGNCFNNDEVRKRMYGMKRLIEIIEGENIENCVTNRVLVLSDFHIPFQVPIETFKDYVGQVDILVLNGDIQDAQSISAFTKKYRIPFVEEMIETRQYLLDLIDYIHPKKVVINKGNHEDRLLKYMSDRLNDDLLNLMPDSSLDLIINDGFKNVDRRHKTETWYSPIKNYFDNIEITYSGDWKCKIGKTIIAHPLTYSSGILKTTEKAVNYFLRQKDRDFDCIILGHTHKLGSFIQGGVYMYEGGCCCKVEEMTYADGKLSMPQQKGFMYISQNHDGSLILEKSKYIEIK